MSICARRNSCPARTAPHDLLLGPSCAMPIALRSTCWREERRARLCVDANSSQGRGMQRRPYRDQVPQARLGRLDRPDKHSLCTLEIAAIRAVLCQSPSHLCSATSSNFPATTPGPASPNVLSLPPNCACSQGPGPSPLPSPAKRPPVSCPCSAVSSLFPLFSTLLLLSLSSLSFRRSSLPQSRLFAFFQLRIRCPR